MVRNEFVHQLHPQIDQKFIPVRDIYSSSMCTLVIALYVLVLYIVVYTLIFSDVMHILLVCTCKSCIYDSTSYTFVY